MAEPFDFTGKNIEDTYQRVVQTDGTNFYDGTGSAVSIGGDQTLQQVTDRGSVTTTPITASIISASGNINANNLVLPVGGIIGLEALDEDYIDFGSNKLTINYTRGTVQIAGQGGTQIGASLGGTVTIVGNLTSSHKGTFATVGGFITNNPQNLGPHKRVLTSNGDGTFNANANFTISDNSVNIESNDINIESQGPLDLRGSINMIGNITASGVIKAREFVSTDNPSFGISLRGVKTQVTGGLDVTQAITATNITASGNISASGTITADSFIGIVDGGTF